MKTPLSNTTNNLYEKYDGNKSYDSGSYILYSGSVYLCVKKAAPTQSPSTQPSLWKIQFTGGTVTSVSVASANGLAGTSSGGATPTLTLRTTVTGMLKGNGTSISAAVAGTDYVSPNGSISGATKTKITYDSKGLVTSGADATTADIADSSNKRYVTDAQLVVIGNTSNVNTGDQTNISGNAATVTTNANLSGDVSSVGNTTTIGANKVTKAMLVTSSAYTLWANNTNGAATFTEIIYKDFPLSTYAGTITWDGTPPSSLSSQQYAWSQIGGLVTLTLAVVYSVAGTTNTLVTFTLPSDCPTPATIAGVGANANEVMYMGVGRMENSITATSGTGTRVSLSKNSSNDGYIISIKAGSSSAKHATCTIQYRTS